MTNKNKVRGRKATKNWRIEFDKLWHETTFDIFRDKKNQNFGRVLNRVFSHFISKQIKKAKQEGREEAKKEIKKLLGKYKGDYHEALERALINIDKLKPKSKT